MANGVTSQVSTWRICYVDIDFGLRSPILFHEGCWYGLGDRGYDNLVRPRDNDAIKIGEWTCVGCCQITRVVWG